jgi:hypothetical protein
MVEKNSNNPQCGVTGTFGELGILGRGEFPFKTIQQPVDHLALPVVYRSATGASKRTRSRPTGPDTTYIAPMSAGRQAPTVMGRTPLRPVGNNQRAGQIDVQPPTA